MQYSLTLKGCNGKVEDIRALRGKGVIATTTHFDRHVHIYSLDHAVSYYWPHRKPMSFHLIMRNVRRRYAAHLMMLWEMYTWDVVRAHHFDFHQARILESIDDLFAWKSNLSLTSTELCLKWNSEKDCPANCRFLHQCTNCAKNHTKRRCPSRPTTFGPNNANTIPVGRRQ